MPTKTIPTTRRPASATARRALAASLALGCALAAGACDDMLTVDNEQSILDEYLNDPNAVDAVVNGVAGDLSWAYTYLAYMSAQLADEMIHTGSDTGIREPSEGRTRTVLTWAGNAYNRPAVASFTADDAVRRLTEVLGADAAKHPALAQVHIFGGYVYLMRADNMCAVTFDGKAPLRPEEVYPLAEKHFSDAITVATAASRNDLLLQAWAGRARARVSRGDWAGAKADAQRITRGWEFLALFSEASSRANNTLAAQTRKELRKETGVRPTYYNDARRRADPRTPFTTFDFKEPGADGVSVFVQQEKFRNRGADMQLSSWQEARLIEAEAEINLGNLPRAVALIDEVRADARLAPYTGAVTRAAVFDQLIYERSAELWLEAQRLRDLRRTNSPFLNGRDNCYPPSIQERGANPNIPRS